MNQHTNSTLRLPKIEDTSPQKSKHNRRKNVKKLGQPYFSPVKESSSNFHNIYKGDKNQKSSAVVYTENDSLINKMRNDPYLDKVCIYNRKSL